MDTMLILSHLICVCIGTLIGLIYCALFEKLSTREQELEDEIKEVCKELKQLEKQKFSVGRQAG